MKGNKIIVALDGLTDEKAVGLARKLKGKVWGFKANSLFTRWGPVVLVRLGKYGKLFLDLKFYDIPQTVANHVEALLTHNVNMFTVHALGGSEMIKAAAQVLSLAKNPPLMLGVTILTSHEQKMLQKESGVDRPIKDIVADLAFFATRAGCKGIICSAGEIKCVRSACQKLDLKRGQKTIVVTPGIRPEFYKKNDDQKRINTPFKAIQRGADYLVIGRAITQAKDPVEAVEKISQEIIEALND